MRIVIDMQGAQTESRFRGIGRYTLSLTQAIVRNRGEHEIILALSGLFPDTIEPIRAAFEGLLPGENIRVWHAPGPLRECHADNAGRREAAELIREAFMASLKPDIIHISSLFEGYVDDAVTSIGLFDRASPTVVTLYDLIPLLNPEQYLHSNPGYEQYYLRKLENLKRASAWLGISACSAEDGCRILELSEVRVFNISSACDPKFKPTEISPEAESKLRQHYAMSRPFVLYTGGADSRKNLHRLVRAYAQLPSGLRREYQLTLAGQMSNEETRAILEAAHTAGLGKEELVFTGYVSDDELIQLYNLCTLFVFPSCYEGFGLPVLEAMSCGAPVISSHASSLSEIIDWEEALFDPSSETAITAQMLRALTDEAFKAELVRYGMARAGEFSWDSTARRVVAAYERTHEDCRLVNVSAAIPSVHRPKLAYVSPLPPEHSGIADYSAELLPELARFYEIEVIVAQPKVSDLWIESHCPIRTVKWFERHADQYDRVLYHFGNSPFHRHMLDLLVRFPGVVVLHDFFLSGMQAYLETQGITQNSWVLELYQAHGYGAVRERLQTQSLSEVISKYPCNLGVLQHAEGLIVHSAHAVRLAQEWYGSELAREWKVIPLLRQPVGGVEQSAARQKLGLSAGSFIVCSYGLLDPTKLNQRLIAAWLKSDLANHENAHLIFVGQNHGGDFGAQLLNLIQQSGLQNRIHITGWVDASAFRDYLAAADMAVQLRTLSRGETSAAVLDCMNYGLPAIVNAHGALAELPSGSVWMLPDKFDDEELIAALEKLGNDKALRHALGERGRATIAASHAPEICAEQYRTAIEDFHTNAQTNRRTLVETLGALEGWAGSDQFKMDLAAAIAQNQPDLRPARTIFVDVSATCRNDLRTGIERVARALVFELIQSPPQGWRIEPVFLTDEDGIWHYRHARQWTLAMLGCTKKYLEDDLAEFQHGDLLLVVNLTSRMLVEAEQAGIYQQLRNLGVGIHCVIYDLLPLKMPEMFPPGATEEYATWIAAVSRFADGVLAISRTVMNELVEYLESHAAGCQRMLGVGWFNLGADVENSAPTTGLPGDAARIIEQLVARPCFLMVGTIEPRKGHLQTLSAFGQLWREGIDCNLVIVGKEGWQGLPQEMRRTIPGIVGAVRGHPELGRRLFWLENVSDEYLEKIYASSTCLIAASEGEGFGLPLIEAAKHGLPVIARDIPVFREVAGGYAHYFSGRTASELSGAVKEWLMSFNKHRVPPGTQGLKLHTWKESMAQLIGNVIGGRWSRRLIPPSIRKRAMDEHLNLIHAARVAMVSTLLPQGDYILDLGGANCPLYKMGYPHHFKKLTLIDLPPDQRHDYYKDVVVDSNCPLGPVVVRYTDMTTLEGIADESVDFVWSGQSIEHVPLEAGERMCREAFRVLIKGGAFCLDTPNRRFPEIHTATVGGGFIHPEHHIEYQPEHLIRMLGAAGFVIEASYGICEMPATLATGEFHYEDFMFGKQITDKVADGYIQFHYCVKQ